MSDWLFDGTLMDGVVEHSASLPVQLCDLTDGPLVIEVSDGPDLLVQIDLFSLIGWLHANRPDLLARPEPGDA